MYDCVSVYFYFIFLIIFTVVADIHCSTISTVNTEIFSKYFQQGLSTNNNKVNSLLCGTEHSGPESLRFLLTPPVTIKHSTGQRLHL